MVLTKGRWPIVFFMVSLALFLAAAGIFVYYRLGNPLGGKVVNVLLLGVDLNYTPEGASTGEMTRTDALVVAGLNPRQRKVALLWIPRDTRAEIPGVGVAKINAAHARGGPELAMKTVSELLGIPVKYYVKTDFTGFQEVIDILGGVEVDVEQDMSWFDQAANFRISLTKGRQVLDGNKALQYIRFRGDRLGDIGRIRRQQKLINAVVAKAAQLSSSPRWPELWRAMRANVATNLSPRQVVAMADFMYRVRSRQMEMITLPGDFSEFYWLPDQNKINNITAAWFVDLH